MYVLSLICISIVFELPRQCACCFSCLFEMIIAPISVKIDALLLAHYYSAHTVKWMTHLMPKDNNETQQSDDCYNLSYVAEVLLSSLDSLFESLTAALISKICLKLFAIVLLTVDKWLDRVTFKATRDLYMPWHHTWAPLGDNNIWKLAN